jgi:hypothetical protein
MDLRCPGNIRPENSPGEQRTFLSIPCQRVSNREPNNGILITSREKGKRNFARFLIFFGWLQYGDWQKAKILDRKRNYRTFKLYLYYGRYSENEKGIFRKFFIFPWRPRFPTFRCGVCGCCRLCGAWRSHPPIFCLPIRNPVSEKSGFFGWIWYDYRNAPP